MNRYRHTCSRLAFGAFILFGAGVYAQPTLCVTTAGPQYVRAEGLTELVADLVLTCTGGTPTTAGSPVPQSDVTITLNTNVTSRVLALTNVTWTEALLSIDEPHSVSNPNVPLLACGDAAAPDGPANSGVCSISGNGTGVGVYNGTAGRPNVWQGHLSGNSSITWSGVPIDAPPSGGSRIMRITNIRVNAAQLGLSTTYIDTQVQASVVLGGSTLIPVRDWGSDANPPPAAIVGFINQGMFSDTIYSESFQQSISNNASVASVASYSNAVADLVVEFHEGLQGLFKPKNWGYSTSTAVEQNQNVISANYGTESGFENRGPADDPTPNPPAGVGVYPLVPVQSTAAFPSYHGLINAGVADSGTHLMMSFSGVPSGVSLYVPTSVPLTTTERTTGNSFYVQTGTAFLVSTDSNGVGSTRVPSLPGGAITGCSSNVIGGVLSCPTSTGLALVQSGRAVYEVDSSDSFYLETAAIPIVVAYTANPANNLPAPGAASVTMSLGPHSSVTTATQSDPIPRFSTALATTQSLFTINWPAPSYQGSFDSATCSASISGWAADRNRLNQSIMVSIYDGSTLLQRIPATYYRADAAALLGDNGQHGFLANTPVFADGAAHIIHVYFEFSSVDLAGSPQPVSCWVRPSSYTGSLESSSCSGITGWVADSNRLGIAIVASLWYGPNQIASVIANGSRPDVATQLGDNGLHGFSLQIPLAYQNGAANTYTVHYEGSSTQVGSAFTLACGSASGGTGLTFYPITPCRVADTRPPAGFTGQFGPPSLAGGSTRVFDVLASGCASRIPSNATAYALNFTVVPPAGGPPANLTTWPVGAASMPNVSTLNYSGSVVANAAIVPAGTNGAINVFANYPTDVLFDITGYFAPPGTGGLEFYAVAPCRIADTRLAAGFTGQFGPPTMLGGTTRTYNVLSSPCASAIPTSAAAYSLNFTVVPPANGPAANLTTWPTGIVMPNVSTLNYSNSVVANAAIVPAGTNEAINVFANYPTDALFDIDGYFAPPSASGLHFYPVTPCRVADTRVPAGFSGQFGPPTMTGGSTRTFNIPASGCGIPSTAVAYSMNFTVVPPSGGPAANLTTWPAGGAIPNVSTLNYYGSVVANAAIVPAGTNGSISVFVNYTTDVLFDINGYFAP